MRRLPPFTVPTPLASLVARLPAHPPSFIMACALNAGLGRIIPHNSLQPLEQHVVCVHAKDAGLILRLKMVSGRFQVDRSDTHPALTLRASVRDFIALALREEDPDTLFFSRRLVMEGDTELGLLVKNTLDAIDWQGLAQRLPAPLRAIWAEHTAP